MKIHGLNKTTLLDYPEHVAATIFTGACNFRCPFCQNSGLVLQPELEPEIDQDELFSFLKKRYGILSGVCITGGEPTLQQDLEPFIRRIRTIGYQVKLDTNGYRPEIVNQLIQEKLLDYVAMDIKSSPENYAIACGLNSINIQKIKETVSILINGTLPYEFRTTVVKGLHTETDFYEIAEWLEGSSSYYLQAYRDSEQVLCPGYSSFSSIEMKHFLSIVTPKIPNAKLRGIE